MRYSALVTGTENADIKMRYLLKAGLYVLQNARLCTCIVRGSFRGGRGGHSPPLDQISPPLGDS